MATVAVFIALGGSAYALSNNSVRSRHIDNGQVKTEDLDGDAVTGGKIEADAVKASDVNDEELTGDDVEDGTVGAGESDILPHGRMSLSTNQAISNNVVETVVMDRQDYGSGVGFNFTASDSEIVIDTPGVYLVIGEVLWIPNGTGSREVLLNKNSSNTLFFGESEMPAAQPPAFTQAPRRRDRAIRIR
jgi:hypothetical protein